MRRWPPAMAGGRLLLSFRYLPALEFQRLANLPMIHLATTIKTREPMKV